MAQGWKGADMARVLWIGLAGLMLVTGCAPQETTGPGAQGCGAEALGHLVGQPVDDVDLDAPDRRVRILPPRSAMTMDYHAGRLNVDLDGQRRITRLWCG